MWFFNKKKKQSPAQEQLPQENAAQVDEELALERILQEFSDGEPAAGKGAGKEGVSGCGRYSQHW